LGLLAYAVATFSQPRLVSAGHSSGAQDVFTLGLVTSSDARFGPETESARTAAEIAVDELNASGGIRGWKVNLATYEDDGDGASTAGIAHGLAGGDRVIGIVSVAAPAAIRAASAALTKFGIPVIETLATDPDITQTGPCIFRNRPLGVVEGRAGAEVAVTRHRAQRIVVLGRDDELGRTTTDAFARHATMRGAAIYAQRIYRTAESDFTAVLRRLPAGYDLIYHASAADDGARLTRAARALRIETPLYGTARLDSARFFTSTGAAAEGTTFTTTFDRDDPQPDIQRFLTVYRERTGTGADMAAANAYEAARFLIRGAAFETPGGRGLCNGLTGLKHFPGSSGTVHGFVKGELVKSVQVQVIREGRVRRFASVDLPDIIAPSNR